MQNKINEIKSLLTADIYAAKREALLLLSENKSLGNETQKADLYHILGLVGYYDNKATEAISWYGKELKLREKLKDIKGSSDILNNLGAIYFSKGKLEMAKSYYQKALDYRDAIGDKRGIAAVYNNLAGLLLKSGLAADAFRMHSKALEINRELGDRERIGASLQNIGLIYLSQGDYDLALAHFQEALDIARANNDKLRCVQYIINIGAAKFKQNNTIEAKECYEECYKESMSISYHHGLLVSLQSLAHIEYKLRHYPEAIQYNLDCIRIAETTEHLAEITTSLSNIGMSYGHLRDYDQALKYLHDALVMAKKTGIKESISEIYHHLSEIYEKLVDYKKSLEYYKRHIALRNQLVNKETTRTINEVKTRYEVEKKEKEAQLLKEKNEAISIYARKLEASNNSLHQFAHIASHDLREPLRMVSSYLGLLEKTMGDQITPVQKQFIGFAVDGSKRMDNLIQDLLRLARVDADPKVEKVSLREVVDEVRHNLQVLLREKNAKIKAPSLPAIMADRTQVMQLLQNIIGNGIKYNESEHPTITISYDKNPAEAVLRIADNGIGIPAEYREKAFQIFQRVPTAKKYQGSGIGLAICRKIVDGLNGSITIDDNPGGGTVFQITIPASLIC